MEKFVVISAKPMSGTRVMSAAQPREEAEKALVQVQECEHLKPYAPFEIVSANEAEKRRLYGS